MKDQTPASFDENMLAQNDKSNAPFITISELSSRLKATVEGAFDYVR